VEPALRGSAFYNAAMRRMRLVFIAAGLAIGGTAVGVGTRETTQETITRRFVPADRETGRYQYVPFEVPAGAGTLRVSYQYDRANGENVVDLGVFQPGPLAVGTTAFRGYSGGARSSFVIGPAAATPGYIPGPLPAGTWHLLLGLYRVGVAGVDVTIDVRTEALAAGAPVADRPAPPPVAPAAAARDATTAAWYMGALHTHTLHSDGTVAPEEMLRLAQSAGFAFVAITDHNNTTHTYDLRTRSGSASSPLWIVGEEVTTPGGHASVWGLKHGDWIDFRVKPGDPELAALVATARRLGGLFSINHPASTCLACGWEHPIVDGIEAMEISNGRHGEVQQAIAMWEKLLRSGRRITAVGSSDWHSAPNPIDVANVRVFAPVLTQDAILSAIRAGRVIVMNGAALATPQITLRAGGQTAGIGDSLAIAEGTLISIDVRAAGMAFGRLHVVANGNPPTTIPLDDRGYARTEWPAQRGYVRFELQTQDRTTAAFTNPVFIVRP
jgi:hypothetical protein